MSKNHPNTRKKVLNIKKWKFFCQRNVQADTQLFAASKLFQRDIFNSQRRVSPGFKSGQSY